MVPLTLEELETLTLQLQAAGKDEIDITDDDRKEILKGLREANTKFSALVTQRVKRITGKKIFAS